MPNTFIGITIFFIFTTTEPNKDIVYGADDGPISPFGGVSSIFLLLPHRFPSLSQKKILESEVVLVARWQSCQHNYVFHTFYLNRMRLTTLLR